MKISTRRKIYYVSVVIALVVILTCAVIINRTLVNTPEIKTDSISTEAGEPVSAYMAYINDSGDVTIGIADADDEDTAEIIGYVRSVTFPSEYEGEETQGSVPDAWIVLYDDRNRISSRMNFYNGGETVWYDGTKYNADPSVMHRIKEYCDANILDEETPQPEQSAQPEE